MATVEADISSGILNAQDNSKTLWSVWGNDLILRKIAGYLSTTDLKQLSCVNKFLLESVRTLTCFTSLASQEVTGKIKIHVFKLSRAIVKLNTLNPIVLQKLAPKIFQDTEHLELQAMDNISDSLRNDFLVQIITSIPKLKCLKLETSKILKDDDTSFLKDEDMKTKIANLTELQIGPTLINYELKSKDVVENCNTRNKQPTLTYELFEEINKNMKLTKFTYTEPSLSRKCYHPQILLNNSRETLTELKIAIEYKDLESLNEVEFPKLSKLEIAVFCYHSADTHSAQLQKLRQTRVFPHEVLSFLGNHLPNLTEFQFGANYVCPLDPLCELLAHPSSTEKLKVLGFSSYFGFLKPLSAIDWDFLKTMSNLRDFKINYLHPNIYPMNNDNFVHFLFVLHPNIKSVEFRGLNFCDYYANLCYTNIYKLFEFEQLYVLRLETSPFLKDKSLQLICQHLTQLKIFEVDLTDVTFFGISGVDRNENINTYISLANLKDLVELEMYSRSSDLQFSVDELLKSVRFSRLVKLIVQPGKDNKTNRRFNGEQLMRLLSRNPSLEHVDLWSIVPPWHIREQVLKLHPRFNWHWDYTCELERFKK